MLNRGAPEEVEMATKKSTELLTFTQPSRSARPMVNWKQSLQYKVNRRIFVYTFCLIYICLSLSDDVNKIKTLNIERA